MDHVERDLADIKAELRSIRQTLDRINDRLNNDFRITWAGIIATNLGLGSLLVKGLGWL